MKNIDFVSFRTDFGFKRFMKNKDNVIDFINSLLPVRVTSIENISDPQCDIHKYKSIRYDYLCETSAGTQINVEMQNAVQPDYYDRAVFHSSRLISRHGYDEKVLDWKLRPTYNIGIVDSSINKMHNVPQGDSWLIWSALAIDDSKCIPPVISTKSKFCSDALNIITISLPDFQSQVDLLVTDSERDKFMWLFSNLGRNADAIPGWAVTDSSFKRVLETMNFEKLTSRERYAYEAELKLQKDINLEEKHREFENGVKCFMKGALMVTDDKQKAYDIAFEHFGPDIMLVLGERPSRRNGPFGK